MLTSSYKYHLLVLRQKANPGIGKKILSTLFLVIVLAIGTLSSLMFWLYTREAPLRAENDYLQVAANGFTVTAHSLNDVFDTFKVAGAKTTAVDVLKDASASALIEGYPILLQDIDKTSAKIDSAQKVIVAQKLDLKNQITPVKFDRINESVLAYYEQALSNLQNSKKEEAFAKDMLLALGQNLYLPTITDETLWTNHDKEKLKAYYQSKKDELNTALFALSKVEVPEEFKSYSQLQLDYLTKLADLSNTMVTILSTDDDKNPENATQLEKAYQVLTKAKKENDDLSQKLLTERLKVFDLKRNYSAYASVNLAQNSLQQDLSDVWENQLEPKSLKTPEFFVNFFDRAKSIIATIQIPKLI